MEKAVECDGRGSGLVAQRDRLYWGDVREGREAHLRPRREPPGPTLAKPCGNLAMLRA